MAEKTLKSRIVHKHDSAENWAKAINFIPKQGEIIVYDKDSTNSYERFKIGDGVTNVNSLPFADEQKLDKTTFQQLVGDTSVAEQINTAIDAVPQPDWNQNDDTAADYIKNKTHGLELKEVTLFNNSLNFEVVSAETGNLSRASSPCDFLIENNKKYTIIFDETEYICTSFEFQGAIALGNLSIMAAANDTGEPFLIITNKINESNYLLSIVSNSVETTHNIIIKTFNEIIYKLDTKYLQIDDSLSNTSVNPVENKVVNEAISEITPDIYAGKSWTQSNITSGNFNDVYYGNGIWVAGSNGDFGLCYSIDGMTWTQSNITNGKFNCIYYDNGIWVAGSKGDFGLCYSIDGMTWTQSNITNGKFNCVYYANGIWVAGSYNNGLYYSTDGKTWTQSNITSSTFYSVYYSNGIWIAGSYNNGLYYSTDGKTWTQSNITSNNIYCIYYDNGIWVAGGTDSSNGIIYYSIDGITWASASIKLKS